MIWGVMRKRWVWVSLSVVVVFASVLVATRDDEPVYQGRKLSEWVDIYETEMKPDRFSPTNMSSVLENDDAMEAIRHIGTNGLPCLLNWMSVEPPRWKAAYYKIVDKVLKRVPTDWWTADKNNIRASRATSAVLMLGPAVRNAIPELTKLVNDPRRNWSAGRAAMVLSGLGPDARSIVRARMTNGQPMRWVFIMREPRTGAGPSNGAPKGGNWR